LFARLPGGSCLLHDAVMSSYVDYPVGDGLPS